MREDEIPPKLVNIAGKFLVEPLNDIINSCFNTSTFPDLAMPIDKVGTDKHLSTNYRPVSIPRHKRQNVRSNFYVFILSFIFYLIKNHKLEQLLYIILKYIFQRACLNYLTALNI